MHLPLPPDGKYRYSPRKRKPHTLQLLRLTPRWIAAFRMRIYQRTLTSLAEYRPSHSECRGSISLMKPTGQAALEFERWNEIVTSSWPTLHNPAAYSFFALGAALASRDWSLDPDHLNAGRLIPNMWLPPIPPGDPGLPDKKA